MTALARLDPTRQHWETVYDTKATDKVSWFRPHLETSLALIERAAAGNHAASILDVGGGASTLVDDLLERRYTSITVLDISQAALDIARLRLGAKAGAVYWLRADITQPGLNAHSIDVWHDRAVFHFLTSREDRDAYVRNMTAALQPGGHVVISTFGPAGPAKCSGLEVTRYDSETLSREFGTGFHLIESSMEFHTTPSSASQQFLSCHFVME